MLDALQTGVLHYTSAAEEAATKDATATSFEKNELNCQGNIPGLASFAPMTGAILMSGDVGEP